ARRPRQRPPVALARFAHRELQGDVAVDRREEEQPPQQRQLGRLQHISHSTTSRGQLMRNGKVSAAPRLTSSVAPRSSKRSPCQRLNQAAGYGFPRRSATTHCPPCRWPASTRA